MDQKFRNSIKNIVMGVGGQIIILALGLLVPRLILVNYGSEVNGLTNTVTQIFTYVALLEAGIGQSAVFALYKSKDKTDSSSILSATVKEYRSTSIIYAGCIILLSVILPFVLHSELSFFTISAITFLAGLPSLVSFYSTAAYMQLLTVEGKHYVESNANMFSTTLASCAKIVLANFRVNIIFLQFAYFIISLIKTIFIIAYVKKRYGWIDKKAIKKQGIFKDRYGYLQSQIAWIVFSNTDVLMISLLCDLKTASVYTIYNMVFSALYSLMNQFYGGICFLLGHEYNKSLSDYTELHDTFDCFFDMLVCATMAICYVLIIPFIKIYTAGVTDIDYIDTTLPILFCSVQILTWMRYASGNLSSLGGYAKKIGHVSIIEAVINIVLTVLLVSLWGISGALVATIVALMFKSNYLIVFVNTKILNRSCWKSYKIIFTNCLLFLFIVMLSHMLNLEINGFVHFIIDAVIICAVVYPLFYLYNLAINRHETLCYTRIVITKAKKILSKK